MQLDFKKYAFKIQEKEQVPYIFDEVRKKYVILSPEEWVRQNFLHFFIYEMGYPKNKIAVEKEFQLNGRKKRFDILLYSSATQPFLLVECKSQKENINEQVLQQCLAYNLHFAVPFLCISNGDYTFSWEIKNGIPFELQEFPKYL